MRKLTFGLSGWSIRNSFLSFLCWIVRWKTVMHFAIAIFSSVVFWNTLHISVVMYFGFFGILHYIQKHFQVKFPLNFINVRDLWSYVPFTILGGPTERVFVAIPLFRLKGWYGFPSRWSLETFTNITHRLRVYNNHCVFHGLPHFGDELLSAQLLSPPTSPSFQTTTGRGWLVDLWTLRVCNIFPAIPIVVLPIIAGLISQAPFHSVVHVRDDLNDKSKQDADIERFVEQRATTLLQGLLILITTNPPIWGLIP